jgi:UDP-N-acetylglucosamine diphosphorylase / glucose-1-phosphate thymidylyltransferase / UDP-N-acetylgalactosamine diphosphorylase / glucosamine-1-phosphate N-acetyltransferase / galactosamine-1-phosphate N-acetyltransferase
MINIIIPMAGQGIRFVEMGYDKPKPLIDVCGVPMIKRVIDSLTSKKIKCNFIFIALQEHLDNGLRKYLENYGIIIPLKVVTEGAACTTLMALKHINNNIPLVIANCDQYLLWDFDNFIHEASGADGCIVVFNSTNPHHSYAKVKKNEVVQVAEKVVISDKACAGIYYYKKGSEYIESIVMMIAKNIRTNNEFYIAPAYNELIQNNKKIKIYEIDVNKKHMLGTPYELKIFLDKVDNGDVIF